MNAFNWIDERGLGRLGQAHCFLLHCQPLIVKLATFGRREVIRAFDGVVADDEKMETHLLDVLNWSLVPTTLPYKVSGCSFLISYSSSR